MSKVLVSLAHAVVVPRPAPLGWAGRPPRTLKRIGAMGLALALATAMSAVTAAAASGPRAYEFKAAEYPVHVLGKFINPQGFEFAGGMVVVCREGTLNTGEEKAQNPTRDSATLAAHPNYTNCTASGSNANVRTTGCMYRFHAVPPNKTGSVDIACRSRLRIEVEPEAIPGCVIMITPGATLKGIEFKNENGKLRVNAEVTVRWSASPECGFIVLEGNGFYREGEAVGPVTRLAPPGHPASVLLEGFNSLEEADPLVVSRR